MKILSLAYLLPALAFAAPVQPAMEAMKPGTVKPTGWLHDRAIAARDGFTGHMDEVDKHFTLAWTTNCMRRGKLLNWGNAHQGSWSAEGGAYWFDGLVKLAWQLDDPGLKAQAKRRLDTVLDNVNGNSVGFLWWLDRRNPEDVKEAFGPGGWRFWVIGLAERVIAAWHQTTGDERALRVLKDVYGFEKMSAVNGANAAYVSGIEEAYRTTGDAQVGKGLDLACARLAAKARYLQLPKKELVPTLYMGRRQTHLLKSKDRHGVWASEELLSLFRAYQHTGNEKMRDAVLAWYAFFDKYCRQPYGVTMMDEEWGWAGAYRGTETCDVAAESFTRQNLLAALGEGRWGDDVERAFFNAGPACITRDFKTGVYFQMPNRIGKVGEGTKFSCMAPGHTDYTKSHWPLCCTAALNRILPNYIQYMWLKTADGGLAAALYGPSAVSADLPAGRVELEENTHYPFAETISVTVKSAPGASFPILFRMPNWCADPAVSVNGKPVTLKADKGFVTISRTWAKGDRVNLRFPMKPRFEDFRDMNDFGCERRSIFLGPLLFAYDVPSVDDNTPMGIAYEPKLARSTTPADVAVRRSAMPARWDWPAKSPVRLEVKDADGNRLSLIPYGCSKLHVSAFAFADRVYATMPAHEVQVRQGIGRTLEKLRQGKEVTVAYFGGSITEMTGWRNLTTDWLQKTYPKAKVREVAAAIGGTGSDLGVYRLDHDVLAHKPDLVFVEFATNDGGMRPSQIWRQMEGIVRKIWRANPETDIVFAYTITASMLREYLAGNCNRAASAMEMLADHYGIPSIGFGPRVAEEVRAGRLVMSMKELETAVPKEMPDRDKAISEKLAKEGKILFARDGVHPAMPGHGFYLKSIQAGFAAMDRIRPVDHSLMLRREPFAMDNLEAAKAYPIEDKMLSGEWRRLPSDDGKMKHFSRRADQLWISEKPGSKLSFRFRGTQCALYDLLGPDGGQLLVKVDGKLRKPPVPRFDSYCTYWRLALYKIYDGEDGEHTVEIEVDSKQPDRHSVAFRLKDPEKELKSPKFNGTRFWPAKIFVTGELIP